MSIGNGNTNSKKIPLVQHKELVLNTSVRSFRCGKTEFAGKMRIAISMIGGFQHDYKKDEMIPKEFDLVAYSSGTAGVNIKITEEMLVQMLNHIRAEKQKVYSFEGST